MKVSYVFPMTNFCEPNAVTVTPWKWKSYTFILFFYNLRLHSGGGLDIPRARMPRTGILVDVCFLGIPSPISGNTARVGSLGPSARASKGQINLSRAEVSRGMCLPGENVRNPRGLRLQRRPKGSLSSKGRGWLGWV